MGQIQRIPIVPRNGEAVCLPREDFPLAPVKEPHVAAATEGVIESNPVDTLYCCRSLTRTCPRKAFFTTASPSQCLPWRCSNWASGGRRKRARSSSSCSSLTPKELGKTRPGGLSTLADGLGADSVALNGLSVQAVAPAGQAAPAGHGRHRGQAASHGGQEAQRPQVGAHRVRPGHGASEPRERKPELHSLQFYINFKILLPEPAARLCNGFGPLRVTLAGGALDVVGKVFQGKWS